MLDRENNTLIHRLSLNVGPRPELRSVVSDFLLGHKEFLAICKVDATALAEDIVANVASFSEKKCRDYLAVIEVSLEKLRRNQGVSERRFDELMERAALLDVTSSHGLLLWGQETFL